MCLNAQILENLTCSLLHLCCLHIIDGMLNCKWSNHSNVLHSGENLEFYIWIHAALFLCVFCFCHWNPPRCAVDLLRCVQLHQLDRHSLVHPPQQHGASLLLQKQHRVHRQPRSARPAQPAGTGRPCSKGSACLTVIWLLDRNDLGLMVVFSLVGLWDRAGSPLPGCAGLCPAGHFRLCYHQGKVISEVNLKQFLTKCLRHPGNKLANNQLCFGRACHSTYCGSLYSSLECSACVWSPVKLGRIGAATSPCMPELPSPPPPSASLGLLTACTLVYRCLQVSCY